MSDVSAGLVEPDAWFLDREALRGVKPMPARQSPRADPSPSAAEAVPCKDVPHPPLVVDLDGTLVRSDLLIEGLFAELAERPQSLPQLVSALVRGKAALKHRLARSAKFDPALLPYDDQVLACIAQARTAGRPVYLASASNEELVRAVAEHLGLFTGWFASSETANLSGEAKARRLVETFGEGGFDYIGNDSADLAVWARAAKAITIRASAGVMRRVAQSCPRVEPLPCHRPTWREWAKLLRVHQYAKNGLVFVPLLTAHLVDVAAVAQVVLAAIAFCLCASGVYILNDIADLREDRRHRSKRHRPLARGSIPVLHGIIAVPLLLGSSVILAWAVSLPFLGVLLGYFALTTAYSFYIKRKAIVDVLTLALLYTARVVAGAVAVNVDVSQWLLAFCICIFMCLALIKRYVELAASADANMSAASNRGYMTGDLGFIASLAGASGFNAVTVFALYISSDAVNLLYSRAEILWLVCPLLMYWIARALMMAHRREMHDDPIVFAVKDRGSLLTMVLAACLVVAAI